MMSHHRSNATPVWRPSSRVRWALIIALAAVYFGAAKLGLALAVVAEQVTVVWPPSGISLAAVLVFGPRVWPGIALGALLTDATTCTPISAAAAIAAGNTLEALFGAWLLRRFVHFNPALHRLKDVLSLTFLAAGLSTMVSATTGVVSLCLAHVQPWTSYDQLWWVWWLGDATSNLVVAPLLLTLCTTLPKPRSVSVFRRGIEAATIAGLLTFLSFKVFSGPESGGITHELAYAVFPFVIWAALRFGPLGSAAVTFLASAIAIWGTFRGLGPFARDEVNESLILIQLFTAVVAITGMLLAAAVSEGRRAGRRASAQYAAARILEEAGTREEALRSVLECVRAELEWDVAAFWVAEEKEGVLRLLEVCADPSFKIPGQAAENSGRSCAHGVGLPGCVWARAEPLWLVDVPEENRSPRIGAKSGDGLLGVPVLLGGRVFGVMEFFSRGIRPPEDDLLEMTTAIGRQIGQFIEKRSAEEALSLSRETLELAQEAAEAGTFAWNLRTGEVSWSESEARLYGLPAGGFDGKFENWKRSIHPDDRQRALAEAAAAAEHCQPLDTEFRIVRPSGDVRWIVARGRVLHDDQKSPTRMVGINIDITERKQAEEALRKSEEFRRRILDSTRDCVMVLDLDGGILSINDAGLAALEIDDIWALQSTLWIEVWQVEEQESARRAIEAATASGVGKFQGYLSARRTHTPKWWDVVITPILDSQKQPVQLLVVSRDVTDHKRMEVALRDADRRKDEFLAMLAHELRNPISAINSAAELGQHPQISDQELRWSQEIIQRQVKHLSRLVDDLLDISRIIHGKIALRHELLEAESIIRQAIESVRPLIDERGHHLELVMPPVGLPIMGDATRVEQIIVNLLTNAAKYTEAGGHIRLTAEKSGTQIIIKLRDNGVGIPPEKIAEMFDLFAQGDRSLARSEGGLGIGLTLVKRLTEMHGGSVTAHSEGTGKGTEFVVRLPLAPQERQGAPAPAADWDFCRPGVGFRA